jgi:hypothetical protein
MKRLRSVVVRGAAIALALVSFAAANADRAKLLSHAGRFDDNGCLHYQGTAIVRSSIARVFDALSHPERSVNYFISVRLLRVRESKDLRTRILEWGAPPGSGEFRPNGPSIQPRDLVGGSTVFVREQLHIDPQDFEITHESLKDPFHSELVRYYKLSERDGGTLISYTETSCPSKNQGAQRETLEQATSGFTGVLDFIKADIAHFDAAKSSSGTP